MALTWGVPRSCCTVVMNPLVRGYRVCCGKGRPCAWHHASVSVYFSGVYLVASLYEISPTVRLLAAGPCWTFALQSKDLHVGQLYFLMPRNTRSISCESCVQSLVTSGIPIAHKPHPRNGTVFSWLFANQRQRPNMPALIARAWII